MAASGNALETPIAMHRSWKSQLVPLLVGAGTFLGTQLWLFRAITDIGVDTASPGWFLNSRESGLVMIVAVALMSAAVALFRHHNWAIDAVTFTVGAAIALIGVLFTIGPGTIFPIVIVFGTTLVAVAAFAGAVVGWLLRLAWARRPR